MQIPIEVAFRNVRKTEQMDILISEKVAALEKTCGYINSCRIAVERPQKFQSSGNPYRVRIDITLPPGKEIVIRREAGEGTLHDPLTAVVRDAFNAARRKLQEITRQQRRKVKSHPEQAAVAVVDRIDKEMGFGFLTTPESREIYFHRNSVLHGDFDRLEIGTGVNYMEEMGDKGPQASTIRLVDKPGVRLARPGEEQEREEAGQLE